MNPSGFFGTHAGVIREENTLNAPLTLEITP
jgi:hypothetical protein